MRFAFVSIALLALSHSVIPGVHGAPAVAFDDHADSLAVRQGSLIDNFAFLGHEHTSGRHGGGDFTTGIVQELQNSVHAVTSVLRRADPTSLTTTTTTSLVSAASTGTSTAGNASSVSLSTPHASSTSPIRTRRQLPTSLPSEVLSAVQPVESLATSVLSAVLGKPGSVTLKTATSKPTTSTLATTSG